MAEAGLTLRVLELLSSRLCHDLVSPVGALNNGLEVLNEFIEEAGYGGSLSQPDTDEALELVQQSGRRATTLLRFYRAAYGAGGRALPGGMKEVITIAKDFLEDRRIGLDCPTGAAFLPLAEWPGAPLEGEESEEASHRAARLLVKPFLNAVALTGQALPQGGRLAIMVEAGAHPRRALILNAQGPGAGLGDSLTAAANGATEPAALDPRSIQAWFLGYLARSMGLTLEVNETPGASVRLTLCHERPD